MKKPLLDVIFASEKRKNVLLLLKGGPVEMEEILKSTDTTRQALLPQIRILEEHCLVSHNQDTYELTTIGKLIVNEMISLVDKTDVLSTNIEYWGTHNLDFIPPHLFNRIGEIKEYVIVEPSLIDAYTVNQKFMEKTFRCSSVYFIFNYIHRTFPSIVQQLVDNDMDIYIITSKEVLRRLESEWRELTEKLLASGKVKYYVYEKDINMLSLAINDSCFVLRLLSKDTGFCNKQVVCCTPKALQWGREVFDYYLKDSTLVTKL